MNSKLQRAVAAAFLIAGFGGNALAVDFNVTATVVDACTIVASGNLVFGNIDVQAGAADGSMTLTPTCTNGTVYEIGLSAGGGGAVTTRKMLHTDTVSTLNYTLTSGSAGGSNWDADGGTNTPGATGDGTNGTSYTVYGRVTAGQQAAKVGAYSDTITATVTF